MLNSYNSNDFLKLTYFSTFVQFNKVTFNDVELKDSGDSFENILKTMQREKHDNRVGCQEILKHYLFILLIKILRENTNNQKDAKSESIVDEILFYLENMDGTVKIEEIAKKIFISPNYLRNLIKKKTGKSFTDIVHEIKINRACSLLNQGYTVAAIMEEIGIYDSKFFYKIFLRHTGTSVTDYKAKLKQTTGSNLDSSNG